MTFTLEASKPFVRPDQPWERIHEVYARESRIQVRNFLTPSAAVAVSEALKHDMPWAMTWMKDGAAAHAREADLFRAPVDERILLKQQIIEQARSGFQFSYFGCQMSPQALSQLPPRHPLRAIAERMVSHEFLDAVKAMVGDPDIRGMNANLTRYDAGQFLRHHDDSGTHEPRVAAYVLNLSVDWEPDWGGLLQFVDGERNVIQTFTPHYNSLVVFAVPQPHVVTYVAPYATRPRLAITGWLIR